MTIDITPKVNESRNDIWREFITALGLSAGAAVALGLSRFAYGLLLPPMRADLGWTYVEAGALNTANGAGYIVGALVAAWAARRWGTARAFLTGYAVSVLVLLLTAATTKFVCHHRIADHWWHFNRVHLRLGGRIGWCYLPYPESASTRHPRRRVCCWRRRRHPPGRCGHSDDPRRRYSALARGMGSARPYRRRGTASCLVGRS